MTTLSNKNEILALIQDPVFQEILAINDQDTYLRLPSEKTGVYGEYYAGKWDEEGAGVELLSTPRKGNGNGGSYGTWLTVSKLYGDHALPFRVQAAEYQPQGVEIDMEDVGDFRTLGEAVETAFLIHEQGVVELDRSGFDWNGRYVRLGAKVVVPEASLSGDQAHAINHAVDQGAVNYRIQEARRKVLSQERQARLDVPVSLSDVPRILSQIQEQIRALNLHPDTETSLHIAAAINRELFAGEGQLINCHHDDLVQYQAAVGGGFRLGYVGTTFVAVNRRNGDLSYVNPDGVFQSPKEAGASVVERLNKIYEPEFQALEGGPDLSFCRLEDEEFHEIYLDAITFRPVTELPVLPEQDPYNLYEDTYDEVLLDSIVIRVASQYKEAREKAYQAGLECKGLSI